MTGKGQGGGDCCCGGCHSPPKDPGIPTTAAVMPHQHYCCRCIPKFLCLTITEPEISGYPGDSYSVLLDRVCEEGTAQGTVQYRGQVTTTTGGPLSIAVRLAVEDRLCYLTYQIQETGDSGRKLINHEIPAEDPDCLLGMKTKDCVVFEAEWDLYSGDRLRLSPADTFDISSKIRCAGCSCFCRCICFSVASQAGDGDITIVGSNEKVCVEILETELTNCSGSHRRTLRSARWKRGEWEVLLEGNDRYPPVSRVVEAGEEIPFFPCLLEQILLFPEDNEAHELIIPGFGEDGDLSVVYSWQIGTKIPLRLHWRGVSSSHDSTTLFEIFDWISNSWTPLGSVQGRYGFETANRNFLATLSDRHVGSGTDAGVVRVRVKAVNSVTLLTDFLEITTNSCCELELIPPSTVTPVNEIEKHSLAIHCQDPFKFWQIEDYSGTIWYVAIDCAWCGTTCGTTATSCCPAPVSRILFAEVSIDCAGCGGVFSVPLVSSAGSSIWEGQGTHCSLPFTITLSCTGSGWAISASGAGACSYSGTAASSDCSPFFLMFTGRFGGGIGCCGVGSMDTDVAITISVVE